VVLVSADYDNGDDDCEKDEKICGGLLLLCVEPCVDASINGGMQHYLVGRSSSASMRWWVGVLTCLLSLSDSKPRGCSNNKEAGQALTRRASGCARRCWQTKEEDAAGRILIYVDLRSRLDSCDAMGLQASRGPMLAGRDYRYVVCGRIARCDEVLDCLGYYRSDSINTVDLCFDLFLERASEISIILDRLDRQILWRGRNPSAGRGSTGGYMFASAFAFFSPYSIPPLSPPPFFHPTDGDLPWPESECEPGAWKRWAGGRCDGAAPLLRDISVRYVCTYGAGSARRAGLAQLVGSGIAVCVGV